MKRLLFVLFLILFLSNFALADGDLKSMTFNDLVSLSESIHDEMMSRDEWDEVVVPVGTYKIGEHIPAGHWIISPVPGKYCGVRIGRQLSDDNKTIKVASNSGYFSIRLYHEDSSLYDYGEPTYVYLILSEEGYIEIEDHAVIFKPYTNPADLGFSFK